MLFALFAASKIVPVITTVIPAYRSRTASDAKMPAKAQGAYEDVEPALSACKSISIVRMRKSGSDHAYTEIPISAAEKRTDVVPNNAMVPE
jgi:hypothetical protein